MKKNILLSTLALLAVVLLSGCSNDDYELPAEFAGEWQLLYKEYGDGRRDTVKQGEIVNFTENKEMYYINMREGTLKKTLIMMNGLCTNINSWKMDRS